jgi:hypothetical protein
LEKSKEYRRKILICSEEMSVKMQASNEKEHGNSKEVYFYQPNKSKVDTSAVFEVKQEGGKLRVRNDNVNCLFSNLTPEAFDSYYNGYFQYLNLNLSPVNVEGQLFQLTISEQENLEQSIITSWIYYYTINNLPVQVERSDFTHPYMVDQVLRVLDTKFGIDTNISLAIGASILRQDAEAYKGTVKGRRRYYDR